MQLPNMKQPNNDETVRICIEFSIPRGVNAPSRDVIVMGVSPEILSVASKIQDQLVVTPVNLYIEDLPLVYQIPPRNL